MPPLKNNSRSQQKGFEVERQAVVFLQEQGLRIHQTNFRCKLGEIDIIAYDVNTLVFVEVRHRQSQRFGSPAETITYYKQQKLIKTAQFYLQKQRLNIPCRFDIIESVGRAGGDHSMNWIKNAFLAF